MDVIFARICSLSFASFSLFLSSTAMATITVYVTNFRGGNIIYFPIDDPAMQTTIGDFGDPIDIAITPDGLTAYVADEFSGIISFPLSNPSMRTTIPGFSSPASIKITPDGTTAYVSNAGTG